MHERKLMRIVLAPDKFKGSLTAEAAAQAMRSGIARIAFERFDVDLIPMADGGEGTVDALIEATRGERIARRVTGPLGEPVDASFGMVETGGGRLAVIEMAAASGLVLVPMERRDPRITTTRGTGELLLAALDLGATSIILAIGGSATNDAGAGMAQALGARLLDVDGSELPPGGLALARLDLVDVANLDPRIASVPIQVACDVTNPLCGPIGASAVYGPQKGATPAMVAALDAALERFAQIVRRDLGVEVAMLPGAGAAGGLGAGLVAFAAGKLTPGVEVVIKAVGLRSRLRDADLCITGEGSIDASTAHGKTVAGVAVQARELGVPCVALGGTIGLGARDVLEHGIDAYVSIAPGPGSMEAAVTHAADRLADAAEQVVRVFLAGRRGTRHDAG